MPELQTISSLITYKVLREFDRKLSEELVKPLACNVVGLYLSSESARSCSPISELLTDPSSPGSLIAQFDSASLATSFRETSIMALGSTT